MKIIPTSILILQSIALIHGAQRVFSGEGPRQYNAATPHADLHQILEDARVKTGIPGMSVAVLHRGKLVFAEGFGKRNELDPFTAETLMPIASVTKAFTAAAIGELVGEGKVDWDTTPVSKYLPEFELADPVFTSQLTFQDLLSHRTGFPPVDSAWTGETVPRKELIKRLKYIKTGSKLRSYVIYNNVMYGVAGEAAANVAGIPYEDLVLEKVLKPLGLNNSGFSTKEMSEHFNYAMPYQADSLEDAQNGKFKQAPLDDYTRVDAPAGDMYSNVLDLVRWGRAIMKYGEVDGKQILNRDSVTEMLSGQSIYKRERQSPEFGPISGYAGHVPGFTSNLALFPDSDLVVAHLSNIFTGSLTSFSAYLIADELLGLTKTLDWISVAIKTSQDYFDLVDESTRGNFPKRIENKPPTHDLAGFVGDYQSPSHSDISVHLKTNSEDKEELYIRFRDYDSKLDHYHYDSFSTTWEVSLFRIAQLVTFTTGEDGNIAGIQTEMDDSMIVFKRKE
ncbi:hypothetical protein BGZ80_006428 [Entomortierella chlamydospora]|uniref:Beta-lactamase/transpeptidase-like protein n=1 Tax=Entomortierella chlamydospora TaxID=101097 RepID=A0A9P6MGZ8_9FUNG|nr:hypothetical protein BGZ80_006428 [Entomortierella chlamydospora]